jgi:outer membrane protein TolC
MRLLVFTLTLTLCAVARGDGDPAAPAPQSVTLAGVADAARSAPARVAAAERADAALAAESAAGAWPATTLGAGHATATAREIVLATIPLPLFGTIGAAVDAAHADTEVARAEDATVALEVRTRAITAWIALARAEATGVRVRETARQADALADIARKRFAAGDAARAEVVQAEAAAARAHAGVDASAATISAASADLAATLGWDPAVPLHAEPGLPEPGTLPPLAALRERAPGHPKLRAARARIAAGEARVAVAEKERWPKLALTFEGDLDDPTLPGNDFRVGLEVQVPFFGKTGAAVSAAEASARASDADRRAAHADVDGAIVAAYRRLEAATVKARALAGQALPAQRQAAELAHVAYREGRGGLADVLLADRALTELELELVDSLAEAAQARAELESAVGGEL